MAEYKLNIDINTASVADLEQELERLQGQFKGVAQGSKQFNELGRAAQQVEGRIKNIELQFEALDAEQRATAIADSFQGVVGAVGAASSAFLAFGADASAIEDAEKKLLGVIGVVGGLRDASNGLIALNKLTGGSFTALGTQISTAFKTGTISAISFRTVLQSLGIGLLITAVAALVTNLDSVASALGLATDNANTFKTANDELEKQLGDVNEETEIQVRLLRAQGVSEKEILQYKVRQNDADLTAIQLQLEKQKGIIQEKKNRKEQITEGETAELLRLEKLEKATRATQFEFLNAIIKIDQDAEAARAKLLKEQQDAANKRKKERDEQAAKDKADADKAAADATQAAIDLENDRADAIADNQEAEFKDSLDRLDTYYTQRETILKQNLADGLITQEQFDQSIIDLEVEKNAAQLVAYEDYQQDTTDILAEQTDLRLEQIKRQTDADTAATDKQKQNAEALAASRQQLVKASADAIGALSGLLKEGTAAQKSAALTEIAINTALGFVQGLDIAQKSAKATGPAAAFAFPLFYASQITAVLSAAAQAKQIIKGGGTSTTAPTIGGGAPSTTPSLPTIPVTQTGFPTIPTGGAQQGGTGTGGQLVPIKTYVLSGDVTTAQSADAKLRQQRKL